MKAEELIKELEKHPEWEVDFSVDVSTGEEDSDRRVFGSEVIEVMRQDNLKMFTICLIGENNYE